MTEDEQRFWDAAAIAALNGCVGSDSITTRDAAVMWAAGCADKLLDARRERQKTSASA